jgi:sorting nexin-13
MRKAIDARIHRLQSGSESDSIGLPAQIDWNQMIGPGLKLFSLPMEVVLKSNIALSFFIDFMSSIGCQAYIFFYLNIEGWKVSAEQHLMSLFETEEHIRQQQQQREDPQPGAGLNALGMNKEAMIDNMREAAHSIYEEYLSEKANPRLKLDDDSAVKRLIFKIRTEPPDPDWFSEVQDCVYNKLQSDERFFESFKKSMGYVKLLAELDLLKDPSNKAEEEDNVSLGDEFSIYDNASLNSYEEETNRHSRGSSVGADLSEMGVEAEQSPNDLDATLTNKTSGNLSGDSGIGGFVKSHRR